MTYEQFFRYCAQRFGDIGPDGIYSAFIRAGYEGAAFNNSPFIQNNRVKGINSRAVQYERTKIAEMLSAPDGNEEPLRQEAASLEITSYPFFKLRKTYQDILTYRNYFYPQFVEETDAKSPEFIREWKLVEKLREAFTPERYAHEIVGICIREGKCFMVPRWSVDRSHNKVNYAFLQQLPSDWVKITGFNSLSGYTVAFNMMYFMQPGTDWRQFGDLFEPYIEDFGKVVEQTQPNVVFASKDSKWSINLKKLSELKKAAGGQLPGSPDAYAEKKYTQAGTWFYWVYLPVEKVWTFEIDDVSRYVISPLAGLMLSYADISRYEEVQLELVQNPLVALVTGEIPYANTTDPTTPDIYKLSPTGEQYWRTMFNNLMAATNTGGIGIYLAPAENLKLQQLSEAPNSQEIVANAYSANILKSGVGILPASTDPRVGTVNISAQIEARYPQGIYADFERMMDYIVESLKLRYTWRFTMFGDIFSENTEREEMRKSMEMGILPDVFRFNAIMGRSVLDDVSMSNVVYASGLLDKRLPLVTSYSAKAAEGTLPPKPEGEPGRPKTETVTTEGNENDIDADGSSYDF